MTYTQITSDEVVLQLSNTDFDRLMFLLNTAIMRIRERDWAPERLYSALEFINHLNDGNPHYVPYVMPLESFEPEHHAVSLHSKAHIPTASR